MKGPDYIRKLLRDRSITVMDLSRASGVRYSTLTDILAKGFERTAIQNVLAICRALEIDPCELLEVDKARLTYDESVLLAGYRALPARAQGLLIKIMKVLSDEYAEKKMPATAPDKISAESGKSPLAAMYPDDITLEAAFHAPSGVSEADIEAEDGLVD